MYRWMTWWTTVGFRGTTVHRLWTFLWMPKLAENAAGKPLWGRVNAH
jgi:hypothetical protein